LDNRNYIRTYTNGENDIPLFTYMTMHKNPHVHRPVAIRTIWEEFFSKLTLGENGQRFYDGREITRG
jgi:hypothetical protein